MGEGRKHPDATPIWTEIFHNRPGKVKKIKVKKERPYRCQPETGGMWKNHRWSLDDVECVRCGVMKGHE